MKNISKMIVNAIPKICLYSFISGIVSSTVSVFFLIWKINTNELNIQILKTGGLFILFGFAFFLILQLTDKSN